MKTLISFITLLLVVALGLGQGYNNRYDFNDNSLSETGWDIETTNTGNVIIGSRGNGTDGAEIYFLFLDETGVVENETLVEIEGHDLYPGLSNGSVQTTDGNYFVGGSHRTNSDTASFFGVLSDASGNLIWQKTFNNDLSKEEGTRLAKPSI